MFGGVLQTSLIANLQHLSKQISFNVMKYLNNFYLPVPALSLYLAALNNYNKSQKLNVISDCNWTRTQL